MHDAVSIMNLQMEDCRLALNQKHAHTKLAFANRPMDQAIPIAFTQKTHVAEWFKASQSLSHRKRTWAKGSDILKILKTLFCARTVISWCPDSICLSYESIIHVTREHVLMRARKCSNL